MKIMDNNQPDNQKIAWNPTSKPLNPHILMVGSGGSQIFRGETGDDCFYLFSIDTTIPCLNMIDDILSLFQIDNERRKQEVKNNLFPAWHKELLPYSETLNFFVMANFTRKILQISVHFCPEYFMFEILEFLIRTHKRRGVEKLILAIDGYSIDDIFKEKCKQNGVQLILSYTKTVEDIISDCQHLIQPNIPVVADTNKHKETFEKLRQYGIKHGVDIEITHKEPLVLELVYDLQEKDKTIKYLAQVVQRLQRVIKTASENNSFKLNTVVAKEKIQSLLEDIGEPKLLVEKMV